MSDWIPKEEPTAVFKTLRLRERRRYDIDSVRVWHCVVDPDNPDKPPPTFEWHNPRRRETDE